MRIAHVTDCYLPRPGGIEAQVHDLAAMQRAGGHEVDVISCVAPTGTGRIRYHRAWTEREKALRGRYDVLHVHASNFSPLAFLTAIGAGRERMPTVFTLHSLWSYAAPIFRASDRAIHWGDLPLVWSAVSQAAAAPLQALLGPRAVVELLPNGTEPGFWCVRPSTRDGRQIRFVAVMRLARRKRPLALLKMFAAARSHMPADTAVSLEIVGDGPMRRAVERHIARLDLSGSVWLTGHLDRSAIRCRYAQADAFIAPATLESFGIAALEARCAGVPVLARSGTGVSEFIEDGVEGLFADDDGDMVRTIVDIATDRGLRERLSRYNREVPPTVDWERTLSACAQLYDTAVGLVTPSNGKVPAASRALP